MGYYNLNLRNKQFFLCKQTDRFSTLGLELLCLPHTDTICANQSWWGLFLSDYYFTANGSARWLWWWWSYRCGNDDASVHWSNKVYLTQTLFSNSVSHSVLVKLTIEQIQLFLLLLLLLLQRWRNKCEITFCQSTFCFQQKDTSILEEREIQNHQELTIMDYNSVQLIGPFVFVKANETMAMMSGLLLVTI